MRTLVIGAGMAGLVLAARLAQQGRPPVVVEVARDAERGYALGLYPFGSAVLHGLGAYDALEAHSLPLDRYEVSSETGQTLQSLDMSVLTGAVGPMLMVSRADLVHVLEASCTGVDVRRGVTVSALTQHDDVVDATFDDGTSDQFDVVVGCDGMHSPTRERVFGHASGYDSGWVLWTWWADPARFAPGVAREVWGAGCFFGAYPAPGRVMCAAGGPATAVPRDDTRPHLQRLLARMMQHVPALGPALDDLDQAYAWPMADIRAERWLDRRIALCGDAAAGFLPTAGVGASNAMRSAAALADELSRADSASAQLALTLYEQRCRSRVERNQTDSRRLARFMFVGSPWLARARDIAVRRMSAKRTLRQIVASSREPG